IGLQQISQREPRCRRAAGTRARPGALNASDCADAPPLGVGGGKPTREPRIWLRSQRSERLYRRSLQRPAVALPLAVALLHPSHLFGKDALQIAAVTATAVIDRLGDIAEADNCAVANRTDLNRRHRCACSIICACPHTVSSASCASCSTRIATTRRNFVL